MDKEKKPVSATPPAASKRSWLSRETKLGAVVAVSFLAVAGGILGVKNLWKANNAEPETPLALNTPVAVVPTAPSTERFQPVETSAPAPMPVVDMKLPPVVIQPVSAEMITIPERAAPMPAPIEPIKDIPLIAVDPAPPPPMAVDPVLIAPPVVEPIAPLPPPAKDPFTSNVKKDPKVAPLDLPPVPVDPIKPEAKNPVIHIGNVEPKKDGPPKMEAPPIVDVTPPTIIETPPKIEIPAFEPPAKIEPKKAEVPAPEIKVETPAVIDLSPKAPQPEPLKKDGEYDEDLHSLKQNESYRSLSKQYYNSEAYAIALQRYNRDHPGQADYVRIPPIWVLEKKYTGDISGNQARTVNFTAPQVGEATPRNEPVYTVGDNGEMLAEIARKQLGNEDLWKKIWDLNPQINPAKTVPGGTRLRMPQ